MKFPKELKISSVSWGKTFAFDKSGCTAKLYNRARKCLFANNSAFYGVKNAQRNCNLLLLLSYQAFYGLEHYNLSETGSFLIRKLNQPTRCLMSQSYGKITLKPPFNSNFQKKCVWSISMNAVSNHLVK